MTSIIIGIFSVLFAVIGTWILFFLSQIKAALEQNTEEIKEMNKDIRDILTKMARSDEKVVGLVQRVETLHDDLFAISQRVLKLEQVN